MPKSKTITATVTAAEYNAVTKAAKAARMSRGAWLMKLALAEVQKLSRDAKTEAA